MKVLMRFIYTFVKLEQKRSNVYTLLAKPLNFREIYNNNIQRFLYANNLSGFESLFSTLLMFSF